MMTTKKRRKRKDRLMEVWATVIEAWLLGQITLYSLHVFSYIIRVIYVNGIKDMT